MHFSIEYHTDWGQHVAVEVFAVRNNGSKVDYLFPLDTSDGRYWAADVTLPERDIQTFRYNYVIIPENRLSEESGMLFQGVFRQLT